MMYGDNDKTRFDIGVGSRIAFPITGWLEKEGHVMKNWNARFFRLMADGGTLEYFSDETMKERKGEIFLDGRSEIKLGEDHKDRKYIITVSGLKHGRQNTVTYLSCASFNEQQIWFDALKEVAFGLQVDIPEVFSFKFRCQTKLLITYADPNGDSNDSSSKTPRRRASMSSEMQVRNGTYIQPLMTTGKPTVYYEVSHHHLWGEKDFFCLVAIDPDNPSRENPEKAQFILWMVANIPQNNVHSGETVIPYMGPAPCISTGIHRIFFFLFKQSHKFANTQLGEFQNFFGTRESVKIWDWAVRYNLGPPVAAEGFCSEWDESCTTTLTDVLLSAVGGTPSHDYSERNPDSEHSGISDSCCGLEKMIIKYSTYHTIACPITACCSSVDDEIDQSVDNDNANRIQLAANDSLLMRFGRFHTIDCFSNMEDDIQAAQEREIAAEYSMCSQYNRGEVVSCCGDFDYRHFIGDVWKEFCDRVANVWERFLGFRTLGCCTDLGDDVDGPKAVVEAKQLFTRYTNIHKNRAFAKVKDYNTVGCCTEIDVDPEAAKAHERRVEEKSPCARFQRFEVISGCVPLSKEVDDHFRMDAIKRQELEGLTVCEAFADEHTVNACELCFWVKRHDYSDYDEEGRMG